MIRELKKLRKLNKLVINLENNGIVDDCIDVLLWNLLKVKKLRKLELNLSVNNISDVGADKILRINNKFNKIMIVNLIYM